MSVHQNVVCDLLHIQSGSYNQGAIAYTDTKTVMVSILDIQSELIYEIKASTLEGCYIPRFSFMSVPPGS